MKQQILALVLEAIKDLGIDISEEQKSKIVVLNSDPKFGDYATNAAFVLAPVKEMAEKIVEVIDQKKFTAEVAGNGFINFRIKNSELIKELQREKGEGNNHEVLGLNGFPLSPLRSSTSPRILLEYFQPNIAKPLHIGHLRTAIIGDAIKRMMKYAHMDVESDTHMGDWGTQFGYLILAYKKFGEVNEKLYAQLNADAEKDPTIHEAAKQEFVKLEQADEQNKKIWKGIVDESVKKFLEVQKTIDLLPFEHHWPESFYEDKMPEVVKKLESLKVLKLSDGAQIVDLEDQKLGVAVIVKSDGGTTYLLRDLATFVFCKQQGFTQHLYVVDNRQSHHYKQLFAILKLMGEMNDDEGKHIDYGFISFKGQALSTRKGNMVLGEDVLDEARKRVAKIIKEKNPDLADKEKVIRAVSIGAIKYFDLSHNRHSDYEFDWDEALDFEGNSGPYVQYAYARLSGILAKVNLQGSHKLDIENIKPTERELMVKLLGLNDAVADALKDYLPNLLVNYIYELAGLINKFYHESPIMKEEDERIKFFRLTLIKQAREVLKTGLNLLGIEALDEM